MSKPHPEELSDTEVKSLEEWLQSWGDGPNWSDPSGAQIPMVKRTIASLLFSVRKAREDRDAWKSRAAQHGCDTENGDVDCG